MMDHKKLLENKQLLLQQQDIADHQLLVQETQEYRWFEYADQSIQSLMNKTSPEQIVMPVAQSLLFFLLINNKPLNILNLGLGGASLERALTTIKNVSLFTVEASQSIIEMAKHYFYLPKNVQVFCQKAEDFIQQTTIHYDVILCDLFIGEKSPDFLFTAGFYAQLKKISAHNTVLMINLQAKTTQQLLQALLAIKQYFPYLGLIEFDDYANIVIIGSTHEIPTQTTLQQRLAQSPLLAYTDLAQVIKKMRYIPH